jgi:hypothetical protein
MDVEKLRALLEKATTAEWRVSDGTIAIDHERAWISMSPSASQFGGYDAAPEIKAILNLAVQAPDLARSVIALTEENERLKREISERQAESVVPCS